LSTAVSAATAIAAREVRLLTTIKPSYLYADQNEWYRVVADFPPEVAEELGCRAVLRIIDYPIDHSSRGHPFAQFFQRSG